MRMIRTVESFSVRQPCGEPDPVRFGVSFGVSELPVMAPSVRNHSSP